MFVLDFLLLLSPGQLLVFETKRVLTDLKWQTLKRKLLLALYFAAIFIEQFVKALYLQSTRIIFKTSSSGNHLKAYRAVEQFRLLEHGKANSSERKQRIYCNNNNSLLYNSPLCATLLLYSHKLMLSILFQED